MKKTILILVYFILLVGLSYSQVEKKQIIKRFDEIEFYKDSIISAVYTIKHKQPHGYSIKFDEYGSPIAIGKYKKGKKVGIWFYSNGSFDEYDKNGEFTIGWIPGCGDGQRKAIEKFKKLYKKLIK
jgi:antitoxin component YwqK of YwqJK toxin-antitoxin module